jgi:hypothetical protein
VPQASAAGNQNHALHSDSGVQLGTAILTMAALSTEPDIASAVDDDFAESMGFVINLASSA